jgi:hypothetical protein
MEIIKKIVLAHNIKIIFIGDNAQLNPVNETESPIFQHIYLQTELIQVMRTQSPKYQENPD